jgi:HEPN domain-containing protein
MPPEPGSAADWLRYAQSDLVLAKQGNAGDVLRDILCFHAQQAVERSIKAVLVHFGVAFPKTHSIERLIDLLPPPVARTAHLMASAELTAYATVFRYPGEHEPISDEKFQTALRLAEAVVAWAEQHVLPDKS